METQGGKGTKCTQTLWQIKILKINQRLWFCLSCLLTEAGSGCLAGPGQRGKYTESECCWEAGWHLVGYTSEIEIEKRGGKRKKWLKRCDRIACCQFHAESLQTWMNHSVLGRAKASTYFQTDWPAASLWRTDCSSVFRTFCKNTQLLLSVGSSAH